MNIICGINCTYYNNYALGISTEQQIGLLFSFGGKSDVSTENTIWKKVTPKRRVKCKGLCSHHNLQYLSTARLLFSSFPLNNHHFTSTTTASIPRTLKTNTSRYYKYWNTYCITQSGSWCDDSTLICHLHLILYDTVVLPVCLRWKWSQHFPHM